METKNRTKKGFLKYFDLSTAEIKQMADVMSQKFHDKNDPKKERNLCTSLIHVSNFFTILPLFLPGLLIWHYVYSMFIGVTCVSIERVLATYYIRDYERTPRTHIGMGLLCSVHCISFPFAYLMVNNRIPFIIADSFCIICVVYVCVIYFILWLVNVKLGIRFSVPGTYRLAQQFQVKENMRHIMLARNIICCATFFVAIACSLLMTIVLDLLPVWLNNPVAHCIENCIFLNPLLICTVAIFSVPSWKKEFIRWLPMVRKLRNEHVLNQNVLNHEDETKEYFQQLKNAWL
ncbi:CRE-SRE-51 protein [Caenorhabditis remanei]|uniref:CRE-SRE-51 protein n=1 Tax=Caenorhabditis remanei TaxID=31234 RepID=E3M160_CAERE|nr:CRE-SRE-51 protein [Caenorhabditis remanei]